MAKAKTKASKKRTVGKAPAKKKAAIKAVAKKIAKKKMTKKTPAEKKVTTKRKPAIAKKPAKSKIVNKKAAPAKKKVVKKKVAARQPLHKKKVAKKKSIAQTPAPTKKKKTAKAAAKPAPRRKLKTPAAAARPNLAAATPQLRPRIVRKLVNLKDIKIPLGYAPSAKEEYMNPRHLAYFKRKLESWRDELIVESQETLEHLRTETRDVGDEAERASRESDNILELRTRDRYRKLLRKIEEAIKRLEEGAYGYCEETGEEIGLQRLEARPIATLCLDAQERWEIRQKQMGDSR